MNIIAALNQRHFFSKIPSVRDSELSVLPPVFIYLNFRMIGACDLPSPFLSSWQYKGGSLSTEVIPSFFLM